MRRGPSDPHGSLTELTSAVWSDKISWNAQKISRLNALAREARHMRHWGSPATWTSTTTFSITTAHSVLLHTQNPHTANRPKCSEEDVRGLKLLSLPWSNTNVSCERPVQMPQLSAQELRAAEAEASYTIQQGVAAAFALYFCRLPRMVISRPVEVYSPSTSFAPIACSKNVMLTALPCSPAPFIVDAVYKIF